jgi:hypothetical protein
MSSGGRDVAMADDIKKDLGKATCSHKIMQRTQRATAMTMANNPLFSVHEK